MCLALPGEVLTISTDEVLPYARVSFGGAVKKICVAYTPDVVPGVYVLVHAGFSISIIDQAEAQTRHALFDDAERIGRL